MREKIYLFPVGKVEISILKKLALQLERRFNYSVIIGKKIKIPASSFNYRRNQYLSPVILTQLRKSIPSDTIKCLGIIDVDLYVSQLNFVFGQAEMGGKVAIISLTRLRPEYYSLKSNQKLFELRILKEAVHELGHCFGLNHCSNPKCVMHFSNTLMDTDIKSDKFCPSCHKLLEKKND
ncbi:MAG: archaemetzincin family Zn-dependent metalloprotease [Candidatus Aminicenantia bacterium]